MTNMSSPQPFPLHCGEDLVNFRPNYKPNPERKLYSSCSISKGSVLVKVLGEIGLGGRSFRAAGGQFQKHRCLFAAEGGEAQPSEERRLTSHREEFADAARLSSFGTAAH